MEEEDDVSTVLPPLPWRTPKASLPPSSIQGDRGPKGQESAFSAAAKADRHEVRIGVWGGGMGEDRAVSC